MARPDEYGYGSKLSVHRAFVVHLGAGGGPRRHRYNGRVEHLSSGETARFSSLRELLAFFAVILNASSPGYLGGKSDRTTTDPPSSGAGAHHRRYDRSNKPSLDTERSIEP